jgi:hypothetical protein
LSAKTTERQGWRQEDVLAKEVKGPGGPVVTD